MYVCVYICGFPNMDQPDGIFGLKEFYVPADRARLGRRDHGPSSGVGRSSPRRQRPPPPQPQRRRSRSRRSGRLVEHRTSRDNCCNLWVSDYHFSGFISVQLEIRQSDLEENHIDRLLLFFVQ